MASYRGAATISAIGVPPTGVGPKYYHEPIEGWLNEFTLDTGTRKIKPYNPHAAAEIADFLRPSLKSEIPTDPAEVAQSFGRGAGGPTIRRRQPSCCRQPDARRWAANGTCRMAR